MNKLISAIKSDIFSEDLDRFRLEFFKLKNLKKKNKPVGCFANLITLSNGPRRYKTCLRGF